MIKIKHDYPAWTCWECGALHGKKAPRISTWHYGKCDVCGKNNNVTEPREFGHFPNWFKSKKCEPMKEKPSLIKLNTRECCNAC